MSLTADRKKPGPLPLDQGQSQADVIRELTGVRILIVEDDPDALEVLRVFLKSAGALVEIAERADEAFEIVRRSRPQVLLSDIAMPMEDGYSLMRRIRHLERELGGGNILAVAVTALASPDDVREAYQAGFDLHVGKPIEPTALMKRIAQLLTSRRRNF